MTTSRKEAVTVKTIDYLDLDRNMLIVLAVETLKITRIP